MEFYKCQHCGNIVMFIEQSGVVPECCNAKMQKIVENTTDAAVEKHVPDVSGKTGRVHIQVGNVAHPMLREHYIEWIAIETAKGIMQIKKLQPNNEPEAVFYVADDDSVVKAYAYCNLHGLWSKTL